MEQPLLRADARANRERLLEAAREVFRQRGLDAEMRQVAELAGVGIATLYRNFATREELVEAMTGELLRRMWVIFDTSLQIEDPSEALRCFLRDGFSMLEEFGDLMSVLHRDSSEKREAASLFFGDVMERLMSFLRRGIAAGAFRADLDLEVAGMHILASFMPAFYRHLRGSHSLDEIIDAQLRLLLAGIAGEKSGQQVSAQPAHR